MSMATQTLLRSGQQLLARGFIQRLSHSYASQAKPSTKRLTSTPNRSARAKRINLVETNVDGSHAVVFARSKRINLVETNIDGSHAVVFALRLASEKDFRRMMVGTGLLCLVPASKDKMTDAWKISGDGTREFSELREDTCYMMMRRPVLSPSTTAAPLMASLCATVKNVRNELANRARGEEGELAEAILRIFSEEAGFEDMANKKEWRIVENEEVDAVLASPRVIVIGFHCNKLTLHEVKATFARVSQWTHKAHEGSPHHSFLLKKDVFVVMSGNLLPDKEAKQVISSCKRHNFILLLKNGANFSMNNSLLPQQTIEPANIQGATRLSPPSVGKQSFGIELK